MHRSRTARRFGALAATLGAGFALAIMAVSAASAQSLSSVAQIAPTGKLRAALVKIPFLAKPDHVSGRLKGVAPDLAEEFAQRLGLTLATNASEPGASATSENGTELRTGELWPWLWLLLVVCWVGEGLLANRTVA